MPLHLFTTRCLFDNRLANDCQWATRLRFTEFSRSEVTDKQTSHCARVHPQISFPLSLNSTDYLLVTSQFSQMTYFGLHSPIFSFVSFGFLFVNHLIIDGSHRISRCTGTKNDWFESFEWKIFNFPSLQFQIQTGNCTQPFWSYSPLDTMDGLTRSAKIVFASFSRIEIERERDRIFENLFWKTS